MNLGDRQAGTGSHVGNPVPARDEDEEYCCSAGCGSGACESCPCCCAGWCIGFRDGDPRVDLAYSNSPDLIQWGFDWWAFLVLDERGFAAVDPGPQPAWSTRSTPAKP